MPPLNFQVILPLTVLIGWASLLLLADLFIKNKSITALLAAFGLALTLGLTLEPDRIQRQRASTTAWWWTASPPS